MPLALKVHSPSFRYQVSPSPSTRIVGSIFAATRFSLLASFRASLGVRRTYTPETPSAGQMSRATVPSSKWEGTTLTVVLLLEIFMAILLLGVILDGQIGPAPCSFTSRPPVRLTDLSGFGVPLLLKAPFHL